MRKYQKIFRRALGDPEQDRAERGEESVASDYIKVVYYVFASIIISSVGL
jgi:hypothetical protein